MFRSKKVEPLRYYLYVSDSKLDMLFDQIDPGILKRISAEVKVDLKVVGLTLRNADNPGPTRMAKLRVLDRFIDAHHNIGTIQEPGREYFRGQMDMQWGWVKESGVWFHGKDNAGSLIVELGGSRHHVLSEPAGEAEVHSYSEYPEVMEVLTEHGINLDPALKRSVAEGDLPSDWFELVDGWTFYEKPLPYQRLEFLAVPLYDNKVDVYSRLNQTHNVHVVIGTPVYVARV